MNSDLSSSDTLPLAQIKHRVYAGLVDYGMFFVFYAIYILIFGEPDPEGGYHVQGLKAIPLFLTWFVYFPGMEGWRGRTFGKELFGLQVVQASGQGITAGQAVKRRVVDLFELNFFAIPALIAARNTDGR